jgi:hypothetical protein
MIDECDDNVYSVDTRCCEDSLWLIKVPNYLFRQWNNGPNQSVVAKIVEEDNDLKVISNPEYFKSTDVPNVNKGTIEMLNETKHEFENNAALKKSLRVEQRVSDFFVMKSSKVPEISKCKTDSSLNRPNFNKNAIIGHLEKKITMTPFATKMYFTMKKNYIKAFNKPTRTAKKIESEYDVTFNKAFRLKKKVKKNHIRTKMDDGTLSDIICSHFEKCRYYKFKDLVDLVGQSPINVKKVLVKIAEMCRDIGHRNLWQLKKEFRL